MPDDAHHHIGAHSHASTASHVTDTLLHGLAEAWRTADAEAEAAYNVCCDAFGDESWQRYCDHEQRTRTFLSALLSCQAEGLAGALVQLDALAGVDGLDGDDRDGARSLGLGSIGRVLRQCQAGTAEVLAVA